MSKNQNYKIDLTDCIPDIAANYVHDSEHFQLPSDIFEALIYKAVNELIDDFAQNPANYLKPCHETEFDSIANNYLNSD